MSAGPPHGPPQMAAVGVLAGRTPGVYVSRAQPRRRVSSTTDGVKRNLKDSGRELRLPWPSAGFGLCCGPGKVPASWGSAPNPVPAHPCGCLQGRLPCRAAGAASPSSCSPCISRGSRSPHAQLLAWQWPPQALASGAGAQGSPGGSLHTQEPTVLPTLPSRPLQAGEEPSPVSPQL